MVKSIRVKMLVMLRVLLESSAITVVLFNILLMLAKNLLKLLSLSVAYNH